jgi:hypothetical protein
MRISLAMVVGALLVTVSTQAAASANSLTAEVRPAALRLKGPQPGERQATALHASFTGSFFDAAGKRYDAVGMGDFFPSIGMLKYSVTLSGYPTSPPPMTIIDFGTMSGQGIMEDGRFQIFGVPSAKGYVLDVAGVMTSGGIQGDFRLTGSGGSGQGDFVGR